jgi:hypothetical protein
VGFPNLDWRSYYKISNPGIRLSWVSQDKNILNFQTTDYDVLGKKLPSTYLLTQDNLFLESFGYF